MIQPSSQRNVVVVVCAAPPAKDAAGLVDLLLQDLWDVQVVITPTAAEWVDVTELETISGHPVRSKPRAPTDPRLTPDPHAVVLAPATFNTINQWASGINNTLALGILNEALGTGIPIVASPYVKKSLAAHPAFGNSLRLLSASGVVLTGIEELRPPEAGDLFRWHIVRDALRQATTG
ncbi:flavoprotein [Asanoa sp. NPDC049518]|uniref:flavoprotein n=1 Tax=unclassified Asanoa TaxID=2685164 RepID=UPI003444539E